MPSLPVIVSPDAGDQDQKLSARGLRAARRWPPYLAVTLAVLVVLPSSAGAGYDRFALPKELVFHLLAAAVALLCLLRRTRLRAGVVEALLGASLAFGMVSALRAMNPWMALRSLEMSISATIIFWGLRNLVDPGPGHPGTAAREVLRMIAVAVAACAAMVLIEGLGLIDPVSMIGRAPGGLSGNRNFAAHLLVIGAPVLVYLAMTAERRAGRLLGGGALFLVSAAIVLSRCRAAWLAVIVLGGLTAVLFVARRSARRGQPGRAAAWLVGCAVAGVSFAVASPNALAWRTERPYAETLTAIAAYDRGTGRGRIIQYRTTLRVLAYRPWLGVGPGNWSIAYWRLAPKDDPNVRPTTTSMVNRMPNNDWLGLAAERGVPAAVCTIAAGLLLLRRRGRDAAKTMTTLGIVCAVAVVGTFDAVLQRAEPLLITALALGALAGPPRGPRSWVLKGGAQVLVAGVFAVVALASALDTTRLSAAELLKHGDLAERRRAAILDPGDFSLHCKLAIRAAGLRLCDRALEHARRALELNPGLPRCAVVEKQCVEVLRERASAPAAQPVRRYSKLWGTGGSSSRGAARNSSTSRPRDQSSPSRSPDLERGVTGLDRLAN